MARAILLCVVLFIWQAQLSTATVETETVGNENGNGNGGNGNAFGKIAQELQEEIDQLNAIILDLERQLAECKGELENVSPGVGNDDLIQDLENQLNTCREELEVEKQCNDRLRPGVWVPASNGTVPNNTVLSGWSPDRPYWVARTQIDGNLVPCKLTSPHGTCWTPWNNTEFSMLKYEALVDADIRWMETNNETEILPRAVVGGWMKDATGNRTLYIGRAYINNQLVPGYVFGDTRILLHSTSYRNQLKSTYDLLVYLGDF